MKRLFLSTAILPAYFIHIVEAAQTDQVPALPSSLSSFLQQIYSFLMNINPFLLIILGVVLFFAGKLTKFIGIILVIIGLIHFALPYLIKIV